LRLGDAGHKAVSYRSNSRQPQRLPGQATFAEKLSRAEKRDHRFLALFGEDGYFGFALLEIKERICGVALSINDFVRL
jgi:hypothetical protein